MSVADSVGAGWLTLVSVGAPVDNERMLPGSETGVENGSGSEGKLRFKLLLTRCD